MEKPLLVFDDKGIYCAMADVYLDPWKPVDKIGPEVKSTFCFQGIREENGNGENSLTGYRLEILRKTHPLFLSYYYRQASGEIVFRKAGRQNTPDAGAARKMI